MFSSRRKIMARKSFTSDNGTDDARAEDTPASDARRQAQAEKVAMTLAENRGSPASERKNRIRARAHSLWENEGRPNSRHMDHWLQAEREIDKEGEVEGDDLPNMEALREASREHADTYLVKSDLEDADQREASPGTREQP
jgi:hypothetical protein